MLQKGKKALNADFLYKPALPTLRVACNLPYKIAEIPSPAEEL